VRVRKAPVEYRHESTYQLVQWGLTREGEEGTVFIRVAGVGDERFNGASPVRVRKDD